MHHGIAPCYDHMKAPMTAVTCRDCLYQQTPNPSFTKINSSTLCFPFFIHARKLWLQDDYSGRQQFQFLPVNGGYNIVLPAGRSGCAGTYVTAAACTDGNNVNFATAGSGLQTFNVVPVSAPPSATTPAVLANGQYTIANTDLSGSCNPYISIGACGTSNDVATGAASGSPC